MKLRNLLFLAALMTAGTAAADDYGYFTLRNSSGEVTTFTAVGLKMTFANGKILATQDGQTTELSLDALDAMYFSNEQATAIESVATGTDRVTVFNLSGVRVGEGQLSELNLPKGVYIVSKNGTKTKVLVR